MSSPRRGIASDDEDVLAGGEIALDDEDVSTEGESVHLMEDYFELQCEKLLDFLLRFFNLR